LNRTITSRGVLAFTTGTLGTPGAVELDPEVVGAAGDPGMSGAILEAATALEGVEGAEGVEPAAEDADWANAAVAPAIRNSSNVFFI